MEPSDEDVVLVESLMREIRVDDAYQASLTEMDRLRPSTPHRRETRKTNTGTVLNVKMAQLQVDKYK